MKYEEFLEEVKNIAGKYGFIDKDYDYYSRKYNSVEPYIFVEWSTGGMSGGSCWGGEPSHYFSDDPPAELESLDQILEKYCPSISFLQYKNLVSAIMEYDSKTQNEYYGNSTNYSIKKVKVKKLYDYMVEKEWLK